MRVSTDQKRQLQVRKMLEQALVPARRALRTGRIVTAVPSGAGIAKSHRKNSNPRFIEEGQAIQPQPITQAVAACIIPRYAASVDLTPWRLADDQKPGCARQLYNWSGTERQFHLADATSANIAQYAFERHSSVSGRPPRLCRGGCVREVVLSGR